jgi:hypothetical protein
MPSLAASTSEPSEKARSVMRVRDLEELSARHEVEADAEAVEEYQAIMREAWCRGLESA